MVVKCPLCGYRFDPGTAELCHGCPINSNCRKICCPNCRYGWVESSSLVGKISNLFGKKRGSVGRP